MKMILIFILALRIAAFADEPSCRWCIFDSRPARDQLIKLSKLTPEAIVASLKTEGVCVKVLDSKKKNPEKFFTWGKAIPSSGSLDQVTKINGLLGKTMCKGEHPLAKDCNTVILASDAPRSTLFHELLHVRQFEKDSSLCDLSKKLWSRKPLPAEERIIRDQEWDIHRFLWSHIEDLGLNVEDKLTIADETIVEAKLRAKYDPKAALYLKEKKVEQKLQDYMNEYRKSIAN